VAGDDIYIAADHVETTAGPTTYTALGTVTAPNRIFVAPTTSSFPPVAADLIHTPTVTISTTTGSITTAGVVSHCEGLIFSGGTAANLAHVIFGGWWYLKNCHVIVNNTSTSATIRPCSTSASKTTFDNVTVQFGAIQQGLANQGGEFLWKNTANAVSTAGTIPTNLFVANLGSNTLRGVDLVNMTGAKNLVGAQSAGLSTLSLVGCREPSGWTSTQRYGAQTLDLLTVTAERSENGALNYTKYKEDILGTQTTDTNIVRTGGASDGTTANSWKIDTATRARARPEKPFKSTPMVIWNDVTGTNRVVTVYGAATALPNNNAVWLEVEYHGSASSPIFTIANTTIATPLTAPAALATDSSTWSGAMSGAAGRFKLVATLSAPQPGMKGPLTIRVCVGGQGTYYIDWQPVLS
jgi:hypothetical protein